MQLNTFFSFFIPIKLCKIKSLLNYFTFSIHNKNNLLVLNRLDFKVPFTIRLSTPSPPWTVFGTETCCGALGANQIAQIKQYINTNINAQHFCYNTYNACTNYTLKFKAFWQEIHSWSILHAVQTLQKAVSFLGFLWKMDKFYKKHLHTPANIYTLVKQNRSLHVVLLWKI